MKNKHRNNRLETHLTHDSKVKLDALQQTKDMKQGPLVSELILSISERDIEAYSPNSKMLVDTDISDEAHKHWLALEAKFGRRASKSKLLEIALSKF